MAGEFFKGKNVFLTGHTGFKGSWLSIWLNMLGANVTGFALKPPTEPSMFELCGIDRYMHSIIGNICDKDSLYKSMYAAKPEIIFHMAAQPLVGLSYHKPVETYETNIMGTANLLEAVRSVNSVKAVIIITTDKCYENRESFWGYREDDALGGYDPYSSSKACAEIVTQAYRNSFFNPDNYGKHGVAIATARAGNVIGGGDFALDRLVPDCIKALIADTKIIIRNPGAFRPWQHVLESLTGYMTLAEKLYTEGASYDGAWNFGPDDENEKSVDYIVGKLCSLWGKESLYDIDKSEKFHETCFLKLNSYKAKRILGFKPKWHIDKALDMVVKWTKEYINKDTDLYSVCESQIREYVDLR